MNRFISMKPLWSFVFAIITLASSSLSKACTPAFESQIDPNNSFRVEFYDNSLVSGGYIESWAWNFDDGNTSDLQSPDHIYSSPGTYNVSLEIIAQDTIGGTTCTQSFSQTITIVDVGQSCSAVADAGFDQSITCSNSMVVLDGSQSSVSAGITYLWSTDDGSMISGISTTNLSVDAPGTYVLTVTNNLENCSVSDTVYVEDRKNLEITNIHHSATCPDGATGTAEVFVAGGTPPYTYVWTDPNSSQTASVSNLNEGSYDVAVSDNGGCSKSAGVSISAYFANFNFHFDSDGVTAHFNANTFVDSTAAFSWVIEGTSYDDLSNVTHVFTGPGTYQACFTSSDNHGCEINACKEVIVPDNNGGTGGCYASFYPQMDPQDWSKVTFNNTSMVSGSATYEWDFDDGNQAFEMNPTHYFQNEGDYNVCLIIGNDNDCADTICNTVNVYNHQSHNCDGMANYSFEQDSNNVMTYHFTMDTVGISNHIEFIKWKFGDGSNGIQDTIKASRTFLYEGTYNVCLEVGFTNGCHTEHCLNVSVSSGECVANFGGYMDTLSGVENTIQFENYSNSANPIDSYLWDFGDGTNSDLENPLKTFGTNNYDVCLTVNSGACTHTHCQAIDLSESDCQTNFYPQQDSSNHLLYFFFDASFSSSSIVEWAWSFGDGDSSYVQFPTHTYQNEGTYEVCLETMSGDSCFGTFCMDLIVEEKDSVRAPLNGCVANFFIEHDTVNMRTIKFFDNSQTAEGNIVSWQWEFGDNTSDNGMNTVHTFPANGEYDVCLTTMNSAGCSATHCMTVQVNENQQTNCFASFTYSASTTNPGTVQFYASGSSNINSGYWNFDDGNTSTEKDPVHHFAEDGFYNVCITAWDSLSGCQAQFCDGIQIGTPDDADNCFADFDVDINNLTVQLNNQSTGNISGFYWNIPDVANGDTENLTRTFQRGGFYDVCLTVFDTISNCSDTRCKTIELIDTNVVDCQAKFNFAAGPLNPKRIIFNNNSLGAYTNAHWSFGTSDGATSNLLNPIFEYQSGGIYEVCLTVWDSISGCQAHLCKEVNLGVDSTNNNNCVARFNHFKNPNGAFVFTDNSLGSFTNWHWSFGDGTTSDQQNPTHNYTEFDYFTVCLTVWDSTSNCQANYCQDIYNEDTNGNTVVCNASFDLFKAGNGVVNFNNTSTGYVTSYQWHFGNGKVSNEENPEHQFTQNGTYHVCLITKDTVSDCMDESCKMVHITDIDNGGVNTCAASFSSFPLPNSTTFNFENESSGNITDFSWDFGNGMTSNEEHPTYTFPNPGFYTVCLGVRDSISGCMNHYCQDIQVGNPNTDPNFNDCEAEFNYFIEANGEVTFENISQGHFTDVNWRFGDMTASNTVNASHIYNANGNYTVCLIIKDSVSNCMDEYCEDIDIFNSDDPTYVNCEADFNFFYQNDTTVVFNNQSVGTFNKINWIFSDQTTSRNNQPTKVYRNTGFYNVCLVIRDTVSGCMDRICKDVQIVNNNVDQTPNNTNCYVSFDYFTETDGSVTFDLEVSSNVTSVNWLFGDGVQDTARNQNHVYAPGDYTACVIAKDTNSGCITEYCLDVFVDDTQGTPITFCNADFSVFTDDNGLVHVQNESSGSFTRTFWEFSDGFTSRNYNPTHTFTQFGMHEVCLTVRDTNSGCQDSYCERIFIEDTTNQTVNCNANFEIFPISATQVEFNNISTGQFTSELWNFSNGTTQRGVNAIVNFATAGVVEACLTVRDSVSGCMDTYCKEIDLYDPNDVFCDADFTYSVEDNMVSFEAIPSGTVTNVFWDFDDSFNSNEMHPAHQYANGYYDVCLTVRDTVSGCMNTQCKEVNVEAAVVNTTNCKAKFNYYVDATTNVVYFEDLSTGTPDNWYWSFGDNGNESTDQHPSYTYDEGGFYRVCLTVQTAEGCQKSICKVIPVGDVSNSCYARFDYYADAVTSTAHFENTALGNLDYYEWDFGDQSSSSYQFEPSHTYADTGYYATCLTVRNTAAGCEDKFCQDIRVGNSIDNPCLFNCVWPGDANYDGEANHYDLLPVAFNYGKTGPRRDSTSMMWIGHESTSWSTAQWTGVNNRHGDCNGDGIIDVTDVDAIQQNFAFSHPGQPYKAGEQITIEIVNPVLSQGEDMIITVNAGDATSPVTMLGVGFEIDLDPTLFDFNSLSVDFASSWLGSEDDDMITISHTDAIQGQIYVALGRNNQTENTGYGELARLTINAIGIEEEGPPVQIHTSGGMDAEGDTVPLVEGEPVEGVSVTSIVDQPFQSKAIEVYPNPTRGQIAFNLPMEQGEFNIDIYDQLGNLVHSEINRNGGMVNLNLDYLAVGLYTLQVNHNQVQYVQRFNLIK